MENNQLKINPKHHAKGYITTEALPCRGVLQLRL